MTDQDYEAFGKEFKRLSAALEPFKQSPEQLNSRIDAYFHALKKLPLSVVTAKADEWLKREKKFPVPAQWVSVIVHTAVELPVLTPREAQEWQAAERQGWESEPCDCPRCVSAGVSEKPARFVPEFDREDRDVKARIGDRIVTVGHWAHGDELARWYTARAAFWNRCYELGLMTKAEQTKADKVPLEKRLEQIFGKLAQRDPVTVGAEDPGEHR